MAFDAMEKPRYTDFLESIAQCYLRLGDKQNAVAALKQQKALLRDEWDMSFGRDQDILDERIKELTE